MKKSLLRKTLSWLVILTVSYLFTKTLMASWDRVQDVIWQIELWSLLSMLFFVLAVCVSGIMWSTIVNDLNPKKDKINIVEAVKVHTLSWILRYIPGQVGSLVNKINWGKKYDYSKRTITISVIYDNLIMIYAGFLIGSMFLLDIGFQKLDFNILIIGGVVALILVAFGYPPIFTKMINLMLKSLRKDQISKKNILSGKQLIKKIILYFSPRIFNMIGAAIIMYAIAPYLSYYELMQVGMITVLAGSIGVIAIFVPSGVGVREAVIVLLCSLIISPEEAIVFSLVLRLYSTLADFGVMGLYLMLNKWRLELK